MRLIFTALLAASALIAEPAAQAAAAATPASRWQPILVEQGKRIEIDRSSISKDGGKTMALGRIVLDKPINDPKTGTSYRIIEAQSRYDCAARTYATLKRTYYREEGELLREDEVKAVLDMPVRSGTLDDRVLREVCRPKTPAEVQKAAQRTVAEAGEAAAELRKANEELLQKEARRAAAKAAARATPVPLKEAAPEAIADTVVRAAAKPAMRPVRREPVELARAATGHSAPRAAAAGHGGHGAVHWSYTGETGPENWGRLSSEWAQCANGRRQSPIDIRDGIRVDLDPLAFDYRPSSFSVLDNGHTVQVTLAGGTLTLLGNIYQLKQFHFHQPAEERVNGRAAAMSLHMVHQAADGRLAVVAVALERGAENPVIQMVWNHLPLEANEDLSPPGRVIDASELLPKDRAYYTYMGSLTTPPCSEGVLWLVFKQPLSVSPEQIAIFARLHPGNARPVQPASGRLIKESR
ncbi:carbonic anhydrase [Rhodocyclus tenuis]|uniref:carbonic anhydrase n=1 Tax=Rhodocyclus tenuis TaxID=1066 RepID=UPI0019041DE5|nr:carbonic anhydrase family protein [Rhodocyclus tenuis]MBK1681885.1 carbonic anhydrase [Rhodocyclus tenuis]